MTFLDGVRWLVNGLDSVVPYLGDAQCGNVLAVGCGSIARAPQCGQDAAKSLHSDAPVDGVGWRRGGTREPGTSIIIPNGLHGGGQDPCHHAQDR